MRLTHYLFEYGSNTMEGITGFNNHVLDCIPGSERIVYTNAEVFKAVINRDNISACLFVPVDFIVRK